MEYKIIEENLYKGHKYQILNASNLKLIAMLIMLIDHIGACVVMRLPDLGYVSTEQWDTWYLCYRVMRNIGRTAFPIFCFFIVEGFYHTSNKFKYAMRLLIFAVVSQYPFELALFGEYHWQSTNVFFTLFFGLITIWGMSEAEKKIRDTFLSILVKLLCIGGGCLAAYALNTDYDYKGVLLIVILYVFRYRPVVRTVIGYISFLWEAYSLPGFLMMHLYNGKKGKMKKYIFYLFYPAHLLLLYLIWKYVL